jgi:hypothetical protein
MGEQDQVLLGAANVFQYAVLQQHLKGQETAVDRFTGKQTQKRVDPLGESIAVS